MIVSKKKHDKLVLAHDKECKKNREFSTFISQIVEIIKQWEINKIGNMRAITSISSLFTDNHNEN